MLGLPFAFASHFAPDYLDQALALYRGKYRPSPENPQPHAIATLNIIAADDSAKAKYLFTSLQQHFLNIGRGRPQALERPVNDPSSFASPADQAHLRTKLGGTVVGDRGEIRAGLQAFLEHTQADELLLTALIYDHDARCRSFQIAADEIKGL